VTAPRGGVTAAEHLGEVSKMYARLADSYRQVTLDAAAAEAEHKAARAKAVLAFKAGEEKVSHAEAEARADADDHIADLYLRRLTTAALASSHREKLHQLREQVATGRTAVASERAADEMHARGAT
jgi:hypothetical protein